MFGSRCVRSILAATLAVALTVAVGCGEDEPDENGQNDNTANVQENDGANDGDAPTCEEVECDEGEACYRGNCYDECEATDECADGQRCYREGGHCVPRDCPDYDCGLDEFCYHGVCEPDCNTDEDCESDSAVCEEGACVDTCYGSGDGEVCPDIAVATLAPTDVTESSATLRGELEEIPATLPTDHGLCWSTDSEPAMEDDCQSLGLADGTGAFEHAVDGLSADTEYFVRAYAEVRGELHYADQVSFEATAGGGSSEEYHLYTGSRDGTACKITADGSGTEWCYDGHDGNVDRVAVDAEGNLFTASNDNTACWVDDGGGDRWCYEEHTDRVYDVAVDGDFAYTASGDGTVCKLATADGTEEWCHDLHDTGVRAVAVDDQFVYSADGNGTVCIATESGDQESCFRAHEDEDDSETIPNIAVDDEFIYTASWDETACKFSTDGTEEWCFTGHTDEVRGVAVDADGFVYTGSVDETACKLDETGEQQWCYEGHSTWIESVAVDPAGNVYTGPLTDTACKLDETGEEQWCFDGHTDQVRGVAVDPGTVGAFPDAW